MPQEASRAAAGLPGLKPQINLDTDLDVGRGMQQDLGSTRTTRKRIRLPAIAKYLGKYFIKVSVFFSEGNCQKIIHIQNLRKTSHPREYYELFLVSHSHLRYERDTRLAQVQCLTFCILNLLAVSEMIADEGVYRC